MITPRRIKKKHKASPIFLVRISSSVRSLQRCSVHCALCRTYALLLSKGVSFLEERLLHAGVFQALSLSKRFFFLYLLRCVHGHRRERERQRESLCAIPHLPDRPGTPAFYCECVCASLPSFSFYAQCMQTLFSLSLSLSPRGEDKKEKKDDVLCFFHNIKLT